MSSWNSKSGWSDLVTEAGAGVFIGSMKLPMGNRYLHLFTLRSQPCFCGVVIVTHQQRNWWTACCFRHQFCLCYPSLLCEIELWFSLLQAVFSRLSSCAFVWICMNLCESVWTGVNLCESVWTGVNLCESVWTGVNLYKLVWICVNLNCESRCFRHQLRVYHPACPARHHVHLAVQLPRLLRQQLRGGSHQQVQPDRISQFLFCSWAWSHDGYYVVTWWERSAFRGRVYLFGTLLRQHLRGGRHQQVQ